MVKSRRGFLGLGAMVGLAAIPINRLPEFGVKEIAEWKQVPTFQAYTLLTANELTALSMAIVQLQKEVEDLRVDKSLRFARQDLINKRA